MGGKPNVLDGWVCRKTYFARLRLSQAYTFTHAQTPTLNICLPHLKIIPNNYSNLNRPSAVFQPGAPGLPPPTREPAAVAVSMASKP